MRFIEIERAVSLCEFQLLSLHRVVGGWRSKNGRKMRNTKPLLLPRPFGEPPRGRLPGTRGRLGKCHGLNTLVDSDY